jgi:hypothetical protein
LQSISGRKFCEFGVPDEAGNYRDFFPPILSTSFDSGVESTGAAANKGVGIRR